MIGRYGGGVNRRIALFKNNAGYKLSGWIFNATFPLLFARERFAVPIEQEAGLCGRVSKGENILLPQPSPRPGFQPGQRSCYTD